VRFSLKEPGAPGVWAYLLNGRSLVDSLTYRYGVCCLLMRFGERLQACCLDIVLTQGVYFLVNFQNATALLKNLNEKIICPVEN